MVLPLETVQRDGMQACKHRRQLSVVACLGGGPRCDDKDAAVNGGGAARHAGLPVRCLGHGGCLGSGRLRELNDAQAGLDRGACAARPLAVPALLRGPATQEVCLLWDPSSRLGNHAE